MSHGLQTFNLDRDWADICEKLLLIEKKNLFKSLYPNFPAPFPGIKILILTPIYEWYGRVITSIILRRDTWII